MGVKNLNKLFAAYNLRQQYPKTFEYVIIDGNNMIFSFIASCVSNMKDNLSISEQIRYIIENTFKDLLSEINKFVNAYHTKEVWFILDPHKKITYKIDEKIFNLIDAEYYKKNIIEPYRIKQENEKETSSSILLHIKDDEQINRIESQKSAANRVYDKNIDKTNDEKDQQLKKQALYFKSGDGISKLTKTLQKCIIQYSRYSLGLIDGSEQDDFINDICKSVKINANLYAVRSKNNEADFIIKNLAHDLNILNSSYNILVISKDGDYNILLSNIPNVWIHKDLRCYRKIFNPYSFWIEFFKPILDIVTSSTYTFDVYKFVYRLSPLFGNDYTRDKKIDLSFINLGTISKDNNLLYLFITINEKEYKELRANTNLNKFLRWRYNKYDRERNENEFISFSDFDQLLKDYREDFYIKYLQSIVLYENYIYFREFKITTKNMNLENDIKFIYKHILLEEFTDGILIDRNNKMTEEIFRKDFLEYDSKNSAAENEERITNEFDDYEI